MTYSESANGITITKKRAIQEFRDHGVIDAESELVQELGDKPNYKASKVLEALGY